MGFTSAKPAHTLEILQLIAFSKLEEGCSTDLIQLKNTKIKSIKDYCEENWFKIKEQWVMYFNDQVFNLRETTSNRFESTFNKIKIVRNMKA